jgi:bile acid:Na+ symporter, BASS family
MGGGWVVGAIRTLAHIAVPLVAFAVGLSAATAEVTWLWRRPGLLLRSLLAVLILIPAAAIVLVLLLPLPPGVGAGLVIIAISVGPVAALKKAKRGGGHESYALGLDLTLLAVSIVFVPAAAAIIGAAFGSTVYVDVRAVARLVLPLQLLPLALGIGIARLWPHFAARITRPVTIAGNAGFALLALVVLVALWKPLLTLGTRGFLVAVALAAAAVAIGHFLGGPEERSRLTLASFGAMRFPALALLLAATHPQRQRVMLEVLAYLIVSVVIVSLYGLAMRSLAGRRREEPHPPMAQVPSEAH